MLFHFPFAITLYTPAQYGTKPRVEATGLMHWEFDKEQMALLNTEKGNPKGKYTKWFLESITDYLGRYVKERLERENGMGDYAPFVASRARTFVLVTPTTVTLKGTPATWQKQRETIQFTGNVDFCVTTDVYA